MFNLFSDTVQLISNAGRTRGTNLWPILQLKWCNSFFCTAFSHFYVLLSICTRGILLATKTFLTLFVRLNSGQILLVYQIKRISIKCVNFVKSEACSQCYSTELRSSSELEQPKTSQVSFVRLISTQILGSCVKQDQRSHEHIQGCFRISYPLRMVFNFTPRNISTTDELLFSNRGFRCLKTDPSKFQSRSGLRV